MAALAIFLALAMGNIAQAAKVNAKIELPDAIDMVSMVSQADAYELDLASWWIAMLSPIFEPMVFDGKTTYQYKIELKGGPQGQNVCRPSIYGWTPSHGRSGQRRLSGVRTFADFDPQENVVWLGFLTPGAPKVLQAAAPAIPQAVQPPVAPPTAAKKQVASAPVASSQDSVQAKQTAAQTAKTDSKAVAPKKAAPASPVQTQIKQVTAKPADSAKKADQAPAKSAQPAKRADTAAQTKQTAVKTPAKAQPQTKQTAVQASSQSRTQDEFQVVMDPMAQRINNMGQTLRKLGWPEQLANELIQKRLAGQSRRVTGIMKSGQRFKSRITVKGVTALVEVGFSQRIAADIYDLSNGRQVWWQAGSNHLWLDPLFSSGPPEDKLAKKEEKKAESGKPEIKQSASASGQIRHIDIKTGQPIQKTGTAVKADQPTTVVSQAPASGPTDQELANLQNDSMAGTVVYGQNGPTDQELEALQKDDMGFGSSRIRMSDAPVGLIHQIGGQGSQTTFWGVPRLRKQIKSPIPGIIMGAGVAVPFSLSRFGDNQGGGGRSAEFGIGPSIVTYDKEGDNNIDLFANMLSTNWGKQEKKAVIASSQLSAGLGLDFHRNQDARRRAKKNLLPKREYDLVGRWYPFVLSHNVTVNGRQVSGTPYKDSWAQFSVTQHLYDFKCCPDSNWVFTPFVRGGIGWQDATGTDLLIGGGMTVRWNNKDLASVGVTSYAGVKALTVGINLFEIRDAVEIEQAKKAPEKRERKPVQANPNATGDYQQTLNQLDNAPAPDSGNASQGQGQVNSGWITQGTCSPTPGDWDKG